MGDAANDELWFYRRPSQMKIAFVYSHAITGLPIKIANVDTCYAMYMRLSPVAEFTAGKVVWRGQFHEGTSTWNFEYEDQAESSVCIVIVEQNQIQGEFCRLTLPLRWFEINSVIAQAFPMKVIDDYKALPVMMDIRIHLCENGEPAFLARAGRMTVTPAWETWRPPAGQRQPQYQTPQPSPTQASQPQYQTPQPSPTQASQPQPLQPKYQAPQPSQAQSSQPQPSQPQPTPTQYPEPQNPEPTEEDDDIPPIEGPVQENLVCLPFRMPDGSIQMMWCRPVPQPPGTPSPVPAASPTNAPRTTPAK